MVSLQNSSNHRESSFGVCSFSDCKQINYLILYWFHRKNWYQKHLSYTLECESLVMLLWGGKSNVCKQRNACISRSNTTIYYRPPNLIQNVDRCPDRRTDSVFKYLSTADFRVSGKTIGRLANIVALDCPFEWLHPQTDNWL